MPPDPAREDQQDIPQPRYGESVNDLLRRQARELVGSEARERELEAERATEQRQREAHYMRIQEERGRAEKAETDRAVLVEALKEAKPLLEDAAKRIPLPVGTNNWRYLKALDSLAAALAGVVEAESDGSERA